MSRWRHKGAVALLMLTAATFVPAGSASGSCVGPMLKVETAPVRAGSTVAVRGSWFHNGCDDTGGGSAFGCTSGASETPMKHVALSLKQGHRQWPLGTENAATTDGRITWRVTIPDDVRPGRATLLAGVAKQKITVERR